MLNRATLILYKPKLVRTGQISETAEMIYWLSLLPQPNRYEIVMKMSNLRLSCWEHLRTEAVTTQ